MIKINSQFLIVRSVKNIVALRQILIGSVWNKISLEIDGQYLE